MVIAAVAGASGYAGGEILRLLCQHPDLEVGPVCAAGRAGRRVAEVHPQLPPLADRVLQPTDPDLLGTAGIVFLALPHGESASIAAALPAGLPVVDLGADHRLADPADWERFYGLQHAGHWAYGLPELPERRQRIAESARVANPGCYPTSVIVALAPLLAADLVEPADIVVVSASGTSGAGRKATEALLGTEVMGSMTPYKVGGVHQHIPEIEQELRSAADADVSISFTPLLAPMPRGIVSTCTARLAQGVGADALRDALHSAYDAEPFVHVLPEGHWPATGATYGSNAVHLQVTADRHSGRAIVVAALDNLVKGAAGQALQNANIMLGLSETAGLSALGVAP